MDITFKQESFTLNGEFSIARGSKSLAEVLTVCIEKNGVKGYGECVPYKRYGETMQSVSDDIMRIKDSDFNYESLQALHINGAGKNAVECAYLDWWAKASGMRVWDLLKTKSPSKVLTAYTISLGSPTKMAQDALEHMDKPLLKLKLGGQGDIARMQAVCKSRPDVRIIVDANESWLADDVQCLLQACKVLGVEMVEQPLPADNDSVLATFDHCVPIMADESFITSSDVSSVNSKYDGINIKLDKSGGLYDAFKSVALAQDAGLKIMIGCMMGSSLAMAPAMLIAPYCDWIDLDGSLWMKTDRETPLNSNGAVLETPSVNLWG